MWNKRINIAFYRADTGTTTYILSHLIFEKAMVRVNKKNNFYNKYMLN